MSPMAIVAITSPCQPRFGDDESLLVRADCNAAKVIDVPEFSAARFGRWQPAQASAPSQPVAHETEPEECSFPSPLRRTCAGRLLRCDRQRSAGRNGTARLACRGTAAAPVLRACAPRA